MIKIYLQSRGTKYAKKQYLLRKTKLFYKLLGAKLIKSFMYISPFAKVKVILCQRRPYITFQFHSL